MRDVTRKVCTAFLQGRPLRIKSTHTDGRNLYLHGNLIAWHSLSDTIMCSLAGWGTVTTRERLNGLYQLINGTRPFHQHNHEQYFNDKPISTRDTFIITQPQESH